MLRNLIASIVCVSALIFIGGCGSPTHESIRKQGLDKMKEMVATLQSVKDESSAKAGAEKLKSIVADMKKLEEQDKALPKITDEEEKKIQDTYKKDAEDTMSKLVTEAMRIGSDPKLAAQIDPVMKDMGSAFKD